MNHKDQQIITSTIMIDISEFHEKYLSSKLVTFYTVNVYDNYSKKKWTLSKRYSEFEALYKSLSKIIPNLPKIPGKSFFKISSSEALTKRKNQLESFLHECVNRKDIMASNYMISFLELDKHSPNLSINSPEIKYEIKQLPLGIRDFFYYQEQNIIFAAGSEMNIATRVDSYIQNFSKSQKDEYAAVGSIIVFKIIEGQSDFVEKKWMQIFTSQTGVINYNIDKSILMVGLDNGKLYLYQTGIENKFCEYNLIYEGNPHKDRIMGIDLDTKRNRIYTCSSDKKFILTNLSEQNQCLEIENNVSGFTNLYFDKINDRIFLTNESGQVLIYIIDGDNPICVKVVQTHTKNVIRGLEINLKKEYIFTSTMKGDISVIELGMVGKEKYIEEISYFGNNQQLRVIKYNEEDNELITGDENGLITIWNLKSGNSIFTWKAHYKAITQMYYDNAHKILITGSKDRNIFVWKLPEKWVNEDIERFEKEEIKNLNDQLAILRLKKSLEKKDNDDSSDDDSLDGWDIRP